MVKHKVVETDNGDARDCGFVGVILGKETPLYVDVIQLMSLSGDLFTVVNELSIWNRINRIQTIIKFPFCVAT